MTDADRLRDGLKALEVNDDFSHAALKLRDGSQLQFAHRVGERSASASAEMTLASEILGNIKLFRLNRKHLDLLFNDGSHWEACFGVER